ncbi:beta-N-acetylhexosaminidase [Granulicella mallensis]|uniref:Beta-N-acetylhexosaminidase n=1 Tax=Granulicella mallensis (strain ATCC BAA-1857 / DSM 23137 / MP5ACTX8) TaxID=682795 RepID=G8NVI4_GRAMM|nr:family 20 glycosylhydrolase [Granulicella mallensis]AEU36565.1 Beta-N-acetylhexosaminidase [Granulicella mallensis MP5ACTX8]
MSQRGGIHRLTTAVLLLCAALPCGAAELNLMPWPSHVTQQEGFLNLEHTPQIQLTGGDERVHHALTRFMRSLSVRTGVPFDHHFSGAPEGPRFVIRCAGPGLHVQALAEDESYHLTVSQTGIELTAANPLGIMHGLETVLQLVRPSPQGWVLPDVLIDDTPRFAWRGLMIDVSRHFMPFEALERNIDGMAAVKLNVLHLHLSDDEGFRVESKRRPRLTELASDGLFYTQDQMRELIAYARDRGVRVVPEFDVPGHAVSWLVAYPKLASGPAPQALVRSEQDKLRPPFDPTQEATYVLLDTVFGEMEALFPDRYFHIGGDEVDGKYWDKDATIQAWMRTHKIKDNHALQTYFTKRVEQIVHKHGKDMEGWDEILDGNLPKNSLIQSWRGAESLADAARMGYKTILSAGYYLDLMYPASQHYAVDPLSGKSAALTAEEKSHILGGEAAQWAEYVTPENLDNRLWPRLGAIAERLWSPESVTDIPSMYRRLAVLSRNLEYLGLEHQTSSSRMLDRIEGDDMPPELLETLARAVEPVKEYHRERTQKYDAERPLNHLVDAVSPESDQAREINALAQRAVHDPSARPELRKRFIQWRDNNAALEPYLATSMLRAPLAPLSQNLSVLGALGIAALDSIESAHPVTPEQRKEQLAKVDESAAPHAELFLVVTPAVRVLIEAEPVNQ